MDHDPAARWISSRAPLKFFRLRTLPGEQAQVDWGCFGSLVVGKAKRPLSCFVMVLSWSRAVFAHFTLDQTLESFVRCHVRAFEDFGGVPRALLYDNLKTAVLELMPAWTLNPDTSATHEPLPTARKRAAVVVSLPGIGASPRRNGPSDVVGGVDSRRPTTPERARATLGGAGSAATTHRDVV